MAGIKSWRDIVPQLSLLTGLSAADGVTTVYGVTHGYAVELNPVWADVVGPHPMMFFVTKMLLTVTCCLLLMLLRHRRPSAIQVWGSWILAGMFAVVVTFQVVSLGLLGVLPWQ